MPGHVMYSGDGKGHWWRTEWPAQCEARVYIIGECQGVKGHKGDHWCFGPSGSFWWSKDGAGCGSTPPGHKSYRTPQSMQRRYYMTRHRTRRVTDKAVIAKLAKDRPPEKGAIINRPV